MSNTIATFTRPSPTNLTNSTSKFSEVTWELLESYYLRVEYPKENDTVNRFEEIVKAINQFLKDKQIDFGLEARTEIPPFSVRHEGKNIFYVPNTLFTGQCFKFPYLYAFGDPAIVTHEYIHRIAPIFNPLFFDSTQIDPDGNKAITQRTIIEALADIFGVIFNQFHSSKHTDWSIGGERDLSKEKFEDGTLKYATSYKRLVNESPSEDNDFGHVHYNSQILSRVFYLATDELKYGPRYKSLLLKIWYNSVMTLKDNEMTYVGLREKTKKLASEEEENIHRAVNKAWNQISFKRPIWRCTLKS